MAPRTFYPPVDPPADYGITPADLGMSGSPTDAEIWNEYAAVWPPLYHSFVQEHSAPNNWQRVLAMRYLAHAAMTLTSHQAPALQGASPTGITFNIPSSAPIHTGTVFRNHQSVARNIRANGGSPC